MRRRLLNLLTALSLLLCVAACVLWARSWWVSESVTWFTGPNGYCECASQSGVLGLSIHSSSRSYRPEDRLEYQGYRSRPGEMFWDERSMPRLDTLGLRVFHIDSAVGGASYRARGLLLRYCVLAPLFAVIPAVRLIRAYGRRPHRAGRCPICGYDLRATPGRCPECGTEVSVTPTA